MRNIYGGFSGGKVIAVEDGQATIETAWLTFYCPDDGFKVGQKVVIHLKDGKMQVRPYEG